MKYTDTQLRKTVAAAGGILITVTLSIPKGQNGGCGSPTFVDGTNGGTMPCGNFLTMFGEREPYYCAACQETRKNEIQNQ